jgi:hypothetical protein
MKRLVRSLAAAALATSAVAAAPARAGHGVDASIVIEFPGRHRHVPPPPPPPPPPQVVYVPAPPPHHRCDHHCRHDRHDWREERRDEVRRDYRELDRARERFYATWNGSPGKQRKFERWYHERRAELDARMARIDHSGAPARWRRG